MAKPMWAIINVNEGRIASLKDTKKECQEAVRWMKFADALNGTKSKYVIEREDRI